MPISTTRASWVLGVFAATFLATALGYGASPISDGAALFVFVLVVLSVPLLLLVHEGGHALASLLVGYRVTGIGVTADLDGWTEWEAPEGRETAGRTIVALAGGPVITLALAAGLLVFGPMHGVLGGWRASERSRSSGPSISWPLSAAKASPVTVGPSPRSGGVAERPEATMGPN